MSANVVTVVFDSASTMLTRAYAHDSAETYRPRDFRSLSFDKEAGALYLDLGGGAVEKSIGATCQVVVDIDRSGRCTGIEILFTDKEIIEALAKTLLGPHGH